MLRVEIPKPNGGVRKLGIPTVMDRVIEQAITQVITPMFEPSFHENSYGFRPNRRCEQAIVRLLELFNDGFVWVVDIDLEKFFDNVPQWGLRKLGIGKDLARLTAYCGDRYQWVVRKTCVARAISKEKLNKRGLVSLSDYYLQVAHISF